MEQIDLLLLERYFEGDLSEQERAVFAQKLASEPSFAEAFRLEQDLVAGIELAGNQRLRERLNIIHQEETKREATVKPLYTGRRWWLLAAAVVAGLVIGWWWLGSQPSEQKLANQYLEQPFQVEDSFFRGESDDEQVRTDALTLYRKGEFEAAATAMRDVMASGNARASDYFLAGLCQLYQTTPDYTAALGFFSKASSLDATAYSDEINWYTGLANIKLDNESAAKTALEKVAKSKSSRNAAQAEELLEKLGQ